MYTYLFSHTFYCYYKPLPLHWVFAVLWSFPFFILFFFLLPFLFPSFLIILLFKKPITFFSIFILLFAFPAVLFPLQLTFNVYKSSSTLYSTLHVYSFFSFFPFCSTYLLVLFSLLYSPLDTLF